VGIFGFGGGYAILPMIYQEIQTFGIVTPEDFSNLVALSQVTPGPIAINAATYVGYKAAGLGGAAMATFAVSLPSFLLIVLVMAFLRKFNDSITIRNILKGIRPATIGLIASAFVFLAQAAAILPDFSLKDASRSSTPLDVNAIIIFCDYFYF
jgi:Chromate transport protein ChrA